MRRFFSILSAVFFIVEAAGAQPTCNCHFTITKSGNYSTRQLNNVQPGQTVCVQAGQYSYLRFTDLQGAPGAPIRIVNCGGAVNVPNNAYYPVVQLVNCQHVVFSGAGDAATPYGFVLSNSGTSAAAALHVTGRSSDVEIERVDVSNNHFAGIMIKTDPGCDESFYRENFTMHNMKVHGCYVHDTGGEGLYIGHSFWDSGVRVTCNGVQKTVYPHEIHGLEVYNNRVERTGCEGIQYGCAPGASVHHNTITNAGLSPFASYQNSGMQIGAGSSGECYNNVIVSAPGNGLPIIGFNGNLKVYNNVIANIGSIGIFADDRAGCQPGAYLALLNNTIVNCRDYGIRLYNEINANTVANNAIAQVPAGRFVTFAQGATATQFNNVTSTRSDTLGFANVAGADFQLTASSALINRGGDVSGWGVASDLADAPRPVGPSYDVGAYEHQSGGTLRRAASEPDVLSITAYLDTPVKLQPDGKRPAGASARVYPSPASGIITVVVPEGLQIERVNVYRTNGEGVFQLTPETEATQTDLDIRQLESGTYVYQVETREATFTGRFMKE